MLLILLWGGGYAFEHLLCHWSELQIFNRCIRVLGFWHLKRGFRRIFGFPAQKCARKVRFYKPCSLAASKRIRTREQNSAPGSRRASLFSVNVIKLSRLTINRLLILRSLHGSLHGSLHRLLRCCKTEYTTLLSIETQDIERTAQMGPKLYPRSRLKLFVRLTKSTGGGRGSHQVI